MRHALVRSLSLLLAVAAPSGCLDPPSQHSAECIGDDACGSCGRCSDGSCLYDALAIARSTCATETKDACNGIDDDHNGVIDDPDGCWTPLWMLTDPATGASCLTPDPAAPPAACPAHQPVDAEPAFYLATTALPDTLPMRLCSRGIDHLLVADVPWPDAPPSGRPAPPSQPVTAYEAVGFACGPVLGYAFVASPDPAVAAFGPGTTCPLYGYTAPPAPDADFGVHRYALGATAPSGTCDPRATLYVVAPGACDPLPPASCAFDSCPSVTQATLVTPPATVIVGPGATFAATFEIENTGDTLWGADWAFVHTATTGAASAQVPLGKAVPPGERATVSVDVTAPDHGIDLVESWKFESADGATVPIAGAAADTVTLSYDVTTPLAGHLESLDPIFKANLPPGTDFDERVTLRNVGETAWSAGWLLVRTKGVMSLVSEVALPADVAPGDTVTLTLPMHTRDGIFGGFTEYWQLVDDRGWVVPIDGAARVWIRIHAVGDDEARFLSETIEDGTVFAPGAFFIKTWTFRNIGATAWGDGWSFRRVEGELGVWPSVSVTAPVPPGAELTVAVPMIVPATGGTTWREAWELVNSDGTTVPVTGESPPGNVYIGAGPAWWFWVEIEVATPCLSAATTR